MKRIKIKPPYISLTQQRLCCVPCAIQWILLRRGVKLIEQETIGRELGLIIPKKHQHLCKIKISKNKPKGGYGTKETDGTRINKFLKKYRTTLKTKRIPFSKIKDINKAAKIIADNLKSGNDIMFITYMSSIKPKEKYGHALLVSEIILGKKPKVIVGDPNFFQKKFYEVDLQKIVNGMDKKFDGEERGIYVFSKR
jgi:hypothetical protein